MKRIIIRTLLVLLALASFTASFILTLFVFPASSWFWVFLALAYISMFFVESFDSMVMYRLRREVTSKNMCLVWGYICTAIACTIVFYMLVQHCKEISSVFDHPYICGFTMYFGATTFYMFRYLVTTSRTITKNMEF